MSSDEEEDVHQCGRCKQLFYSLDLYFQHKKTKSCQKGAATEGGRLGTKEGAQKHRREGKSLCENGLVAGLDGLLPTLVSSQESDQKSFPRQDAPFSTISMEMADSLSLQQENRVVVAPAKKRLAARELALKPPGGDTSSHVLQKAQGVEATTVEKKVRGSKRRSTAKNMKKAWAENYKDSVEELTARDTDIQGADATALHVPPCKVENGDALRVPVPLDVQSIGRRSRLLKGDLHIAEPSDRPSVTKLRDSTEDLDTEEEWDGPNHNSVGEVAEHPKRKRRSRHSRGGSGGSGSSRTGGKCKVAVSQTNVSESPTQASPQQESVALEWSDGGEEGLPVLKLINSIKGNLDNMDQEHSESNGDKENEGLRGPVAETGSDSECGVTVEQAVKRFIFTRGRSKRKAAKDQAGGGADSGCVSNRWQRENHRAGEEQGVNKKVQRRKRGMGYKCIVCGFETVYKSEYQRHTRKEHSMSHYSCNKCSMEFKSMAKATRHVEAEGPCHGAQVNHTPGEPASLMLTRQGMESRRSLEERDKQSGFSFQVWFPFDETGIALDVCRELCLGQQGIISLTMRCSECQYVAHSFKQAQEHFRQHWTYLPALCCFCGRCLPSRYRLIQHVSSLVHDHLDEDRLVQVKSSINQTVGADETRYSSGGQLTCPKCSRKFIQSTGLAQHLISYHQVLKVEKKYHCGHCSQIFSKQTDLLTHLRNQHQGELQACDYMCPVCERGFKVKSHALRHRECLHTPLQQVPYESESSTLDLDILLSAPSGEQYSCFVCLQVCSGRASYLEHMYKHRVWVPHPNRGAKPRDLFEQIVDSTDGSTVMKIRVKMELDLNSRLLTEEERSGLVKKVNMIAEKRRRKFKVKGIRPLSGHGESEMDIVAMADGTPQVADAVSVLQSMADNIPKPSCAGNSQFDFPDNIDDAMETGEDNQTFHDAEVTVGGNSPRDLLLKSPLKLASPDVGVGDNRENNRKLGQNVDGRKMENGEAEEKSQRLLCAFCLTLADSLEEMYSHIVHTHSLVATFRCVKSECGLHFDTVEEYEGHSRIHSQRAFICNICNWHMEKASQLQVHKSASHRSLHCLDTGHCCQVCHKTFVSQEALLQHIDQDPHHHQCPHCSKVFKSRADLADHEMIHTSTKSLLCEQCGATFVNKLTLNRHRQVHSKRNHHCKLCPLAFNKREHLRRHLSTIHSNEKPHQCNYPGCEKRFKRKDKLQEHLKKHSPDKPYICGLCGRRYRYREGLRYHEKTHNSEGHYQCSKCHVHFNRPSMLQQHMQQQHNIITSKRLLYPCELCNMAFQRPERRSRHMERSHNITVEWPLRCDLCGRGFPGEKSLETHMKERHANKAKKRATKVDRFMETVGERAEVMQGGGGHKDWNTAAEDGLAEENVGIQYQTEDMVQQAINQTIRLDGVYPVEYSNPQVVQVVKVDQAGADRQTTDQQQPPQPVQWYTQPTVQPINMGDVAMQGVLPTTNLTAFQVENPYPVSLVPGGSQPPAGSTFFQLNQQVLQLNASQLMPAAQGSNSQAGNTYMAIGDTQVGFQIDQPAQVVQEQATVNVVQDYGTKNQDQWMQSTKTPTKAKTPRKKARPKKKTPQKAKKSGEIPEIKIQYEGKDMNHSQLLVQLQQQALAHQQQQQEEEEEELRASQQEVMDSQQQITFQPSTDINPRMVATDAATPGQKPSFETSVTLFPNVNIQVQDAGQSVATATNTVLTASQPSTSYNTATLPRELTELLMRSFMSQIQKQQPAQTQVINRNINLTPTSLTGLAQVDNGQVKMTITDLQRQDEGVQSAENTSQLQQLLQGPPYKPQVIRPQSDQGGTVGGHMLTSEEQADGSDDHKTNESKGNSMRLPHQTQVVHWQGDASLKQQQAQVVESQVTAASLSAALGCTFTPQVVPTTTNQAPSQHVQNFLPNIVFPVSTQQPSSSSDALKSQQQVVLGVGSEGLTTKLGSEQTSLLYQQLMGSQQAGEQPQVQIGGGEPGPQTAFLLNNSSLTGQQQQQTFVLATPSMMSSSQTPPTYLLTTASGAVTPPSVTQAQLIQIQGPGLSGSDTPEQMQQTYGLLEPYNSMKANPDSKNQFLAQ